MQIVVLLTVLFLSACISPSPTPEQQDIPTESSAYYLLDTKTGIPDVDKVLAAVASGNPDDLRELVRYTAAPCTTAEGLGGPPKCEQGVAEGTVFEVLPILGSEGSYIEKEDIGNWAGIDAVGLYAVYRVSENALQEDYFPAGEFIAFFVPPEGQPGIGLRIADGGIVRVDYQFDVFPDSIISVVERDTSEIILAPKDR